MGIEPTTFLITACPQTGSERFPHVEFSLNITLLQSKISTFPGGLIYVKSPTSPMAVLKRLRMETVLVQPSAVPESPVRLLSTGKSHSPKPSASPWGSLGRKTRLLKISTLNPASRAKRVINSDSEEVSGCPWISGMCNTRKPVPLGKPLVLE